MAPPATRTILIATASEQGAWSRFRDSPEAADHRGDPLDRWSERVIRSVAEELDATPLFPNARPHWPFLTWAMRAEPLWPSPVGMSVHATYGLWYSCRGALAFPTRLTLPRSPAQRRPCDDCGPRPCLDACPVGAFREGRYDAVRCATHVASPAGTECRERGCLARRACPVGESYAHSPERALFHMTAFLKAMRSGDS